MLVYDHSVGAAAVSVPCLVCGKMVRLADAVIDPEGPPFQAYFHKECVPEGEPLPTHCNIFGCCRPGCLGKE